MIGLNKFYNLINWRSITHKYNLTLSFVKLYFDKFEFCGWITGTDVEMNNLSNYIGLSEYVLEELDNDKKGDYDKFK